jgi:hypothetical protein
MRAVLEADHPMNVRGVFYQISNLGLIEKEEREYKSTIVRLLGVMRREGAIPYGWLADSTRWMRKPQTYGSLQQMLDESITFYRRDLWANQPSYVEVWLEKDALSGVILPVTEEFDVPLMVTRGYASLSFLHNDAEAITAQGKPTFLYYLGDHDPSGVHIPKKIEQTLRELAPEAEIRFEVIAVTREQIRRLKLPTRPTKKSDTRARDFKGRSVELDAIPARELRRLVRRCIEQHINHSLLETTERIEEEERATLARMVEGAA